MESDSTADIAKENTDRFFGRIDWIAFLLSFVLAMSVYLYTLAPTVTLEDSGEMAVACDHLGVPHPPGYPLWTMLGWGFTEIFQFVKYMGQPNPAWAVALMSAFFSALTAGLIGMLVSRMGRRHLAGITPGSAIPMISGVAAGLAAAFGPVQWSQSVIVEVYTMNAFLVVLHLLLAIVWIERPSNKLLFIMAFLFGVSFTHYFYASAVNILILVSAILVRDKKLFWDSTATGLVGLGITAIAIQGFQSQVIRTASFMVGSIKWAIKGGGDGITEVLGNRLLWTSQALGAIAVAAACLTVIHFKFPRDRKLERSVLKGVIIVIAGAVAIHLLTKTYVAMATNVQIELLLKQQASLFTRGITYIFIPFILWAAQLKFFPRAHKKITAIVVPLLIMTFMLMAGACFLRAMAIGKAPPADGRPLFQALSAIPVTKHLLTGTLMIALAPIIWIWRGKVLSEWKRTIPMALLAGSIWILIHLYLPWSSEQNPPMNWGYPRTPEGFKHAVFRGQYQKIVPSDPFSALFMKQTAHYSHLLSRQFTLPIMLFGLLPFTAWTIRFGRKKFRASQVCLILGVLILPLYIPSMLLNNFCGTPVPDWINSSCNILLGTILLCAKVGLTAILLGWAAKWFIKQKITTDRLIYLVPVVIVGALIFSPLKGVTDESIRKSFALKDYITVPFQAIFWSEARVFIVSVLRIAALLAITISLFGAIVISFHRLIKWLWSRRMEKEQGLYVALSIIPAIIIMALTWRAAPITFESFFQLLKGPANEGGLLGTVVKGADGLESYVLSTFTVLFVCISMTIYSLAAFLLAIRHWLAGTGEESESLSCEWDIDVCFREWLFVCFTTFFVWGIVFTCYANIKMDVQDTFIQRVKFLTSFSIFTIWIGYGIILAVNRLIPSFFSRNKSLIARNACFCVIMILPFVPILNNAYNKTIINEVGACDLNGHDFGWQFGNYQLRGAESIFEELDTEEEPLPNAMYPPEMGPDAIFFGGTDPGRFVPTYMIFSALVRPDVFLITQNALADNTYMKVMRDLYGNDIWIPGELDSARAFDRYVREVRAGTRQPNAAINIEGGRVQVSGALGVMEINGILAQMIFENNIFRHEFYVEESYVIGWMYDYLTPHGLIMKINSNKTGIAKNEVRDDRDFWDWYVRRLTGNSRFRRDVSARKSFSKLRSALAGLYANKRNMPMAEAAYHQARILYPQSPEGNFRLAQEVLMPQGRFTAAKEILLGLAELDERNDKPKQLADQIDRIQNVQIEIGKLEQVMRNNKLSLQDAFQLSRLYAQVHQWGKFQSLTANITRNTNLPWNLHYDFTKLCRQAGRKNEAVQALDACYNKIPANIQPQVLLEAAQIYLWAQQLDKGARALQRYLNLQPNDWRGWLDLTVLQMNVLKQTNAASHSLEQAIRYGGSEAMNIVNRDQRFAPLKKKGIKQPQRQDARTMAPFKTPTSKRPWGPKKFGPRK